MVNNKPITLTDFKLPYKCHFCPAILHTPTELFNHLKQQHNEKEFKAYADVLDAVSGWFIKASACILRQVEQMAISLQKFLAFVPTPESNKTIAEMLIETNELPEQMRGYFQHMVDGSFHPIIYIPKKLEKTIVKPYFKAHGYHWDPTILAWVRD